MNQIITKSLKVLLIVPGSGDSFYCGNCFRDNLYAQALRRAGHEVVVMPIYLPLTFSSFTGNTPLFFPATSYFVAQKYFTKGRMPRLFEKMLNAPYLLRLASSLSGTTSAKGMEQMTLSMIGGNDINFAKQIEKVIQWITHHDRPDIIHLSTSLLIGVAKAIKCSVDIPTVCSLQDEEIWIDSLEERYACQAWEAIRSNIHYIDRFTASSQFYRSRALSRFPEIGEVEVVYPGIDSEKYRWSDYPKEPTIGFFYRMNYENGLDILAETFVHLKKENVIPGLKLKIGGGYTRENKRFVRRVRKTLQPYIQDVIWLERYSLEAHETFYRDISLICVPLRFNEAVGLYLCEAFAAGRPAVEPIAGSFPEIVFNAGALYDPNTPDALATAIRELLSNPTHYTQCCQNALHLSQSRHNQAALSTSLQRVYSRLL